MSKKWQILLSIIIIIFSHLTYFDRIASAGFFDWLDSNKESIAPPISTTVKSNSASFENLFKWSGRESSKQAEEKTKEKVELKVIKTYVVRATGYSSTPDQTDDTPFITAKGSYVRDGIIAANFLPFDTKIRIPELYGDKIFIVEDRMNKRYWMNIDIWFPERSIAKSFGSRQVILEIIEES